MGEFINNLIEIGTARRDAEAAQELANELSEVHRNTYQTDCLIDFVQGDCDTGLRFNFETESYNIFLKNLASKVSLLEFPVVSHYSESFLTRKEKLLSIAFHEIRHRVQREGIRLFNPDIRLRKKELQRILSTISLLRGDLFWNNMFIFEREEFDAQFITAVACHRYRLNYSLMSISKTLRWEPKAK